MKCFKKIITFLFITIFIIGATSCNGEDKKQDVDRSADTQKSIQYSDIMVLSKEADGETAYSISGNQLKKAEKLENVSDIKYIINKNLSIYTNVISQGANLTKNYISIIYDKSKNTIKGKYSYKDVRLSYNGEKLAVRSFSDDSLFSAEGLCVYDVNTGKKINFDNKVLVSGDLYRWDSNNNLLYYGVESGEKDYGKIYSYDFQQDKRNIVFDKFNGYCTFFAPLKNRDLLYVENNGELNNMYYYNGENNKSILIGNTIDKIEDYALDYKNNIMYFIGKETGANADSLYRFNMSDKSLKRITYDFPKSIDESAGIAVDNAGRVYFCGLDQSTNADNIYMYVNENNSVNLITDKSGIYHIIHSLP